MRMQRQAGSPSYGGGGGSCRLQPFPQSQLPSGEQLAIQHTVQFYATPIILEPLPLLLLMKLYVFIALTLTDLYGFL